MPETTRSYLAGAFNLRDYTATATASFPAGTYTGYAFNLDTGAVLGRKTATLSAASRASTNGWAIINGRPYLRIASGIWNGYWIAESVVQQV